MNGSVTPVTGIRPTTTKRFKRVWKAIEKVIPKAKNLAYESLASTAILNPL